MESPKNGAVSFFVPCLNEEGNVGRVIDEVIEMMKEINRPFEFIVFDDASTDNTKDVVEEYARRDSRIKYFRTEKNIGVTELRDRILE
mgnify:CR=1 FL=1